MKCSKSETFSKEHCIPDVRFNESDQTLTSFAGLIVFQALFQRLDLKERIKECFKHMQVSPIYGHHTIVLVLVVHLILGYRRLRDREYYKNDPMVLRVLGIKSFPDVSTITRTMKSSDDEGIRKLKDLSNQIVTDRLRELRLATVTLDFDGSVISTKKHAEGAAVGYNKLHKGRRSYYPLFCTVAQTGQFFDVLHRPGNVHDSNGASDFMTTCITGINQLLPNAKIEARLDSAFFNDEILFDLDDMKAEFTASLPFERFSNLKVIIENKRRWSKIDDDWSFFEVTWSPDSWDDDFRVVCYRRKVKLQEKKALLQGDLFEPKSFDFDYKAVITNKKCSAKKVLRFHNGRGSQEGLFGEAKTHAKLDYVPVMNLNGNRFYAISAMLTHNLTRELQMATNEVRSKTTEKRAALWLFETLHTLRQKIIQRAGKLIRPQGKLTLVLENNEQVKEDLKKYLAAANLSRVA